MKTAATIFVVGVIVVVGAIVGLVPNDAQDHGKEVYATQKCGFCHSIAGVGGDRLALDGAGSKLKPEEIKKWIRTPKAMKSDTTMKPYPNLPERDLNDLTAYLMTLK